MKKSIIYCRCSTSTKRKKIGAEGDIYLHQQDPMLQPPMIHKAFPDSINAEIMVESGASAFKNDGNIQNRPVFAEILRRIEAGEVETLFVFDLDRCYRNRRKSLELVELCIKHDCSIRSVNQKWLNEIANIKPKAVAEMMTNIIINVVTYLSEEDSRSKSEKIKSSVRVVDNKTVSVRGAIWGRPTEISPQQILALKAMRAEGLTFRAISEKSGYSLACVHENITR